MTAFLLRDHRVPARRESPRLGFVRVPKAGDIRKIETAVSVKVTEGLKTIRLLRADIDTTALKSRVTVEVRLARAARESRIAAVIGEDLSGDVDTYPFRCMAVWGNAPAIC